jgi:hypothetical protein
MARLGFNTPRSQAKASHAWEIARTRRRFTASELQGFATLSVNLARHLVREWIAEGRVVVAEAGGQGKACVVSVVTDWQPGPVDGPRSAELNMWTAIRRLREFTPTDIAAHAATPDQPVTALQSTTYARALLAAGYVRVRERAIPGRREARYRLIRDTGPQAPVVRRVQVLCDPNDRLLTPLGYGVPWK